MGSKRERNKNEAGQDESCTGVRVTCTTDLYDDEEFLDAAILSILLDS